MIALRCLSCGLTVAYRGSETDFCPRCLMRDQQCVKLIPVSDRPSPMSAGNMGRLSIHTTVREAHHRISLTGELDVASAPILEDALAEACASGAKEVVLDLSGVDFLDSMGVRSLLRAKAQCERHDCQYSLTPAQKPVQRVLEDTGILGRLPFRRTNAPRISSADER